MTSVLHRNLGNDDIVAAEVRFMLEVGEKYDLIMSRCCGNIFSGWLLAKQGVIPMAIVQIHYGLEGYKKLDHIMYQPHRLAMFCGGITLGWQFG